MSAMISGQMSAGQTSYVSPQKRLVSEAPEQSERGSRFERYQRAGTPPAGRHLRNVRAFTASVARRRCECVLYAGAGSRSSHAILIRPQCRGNRS